MDSPPDEPHDSSKPPSSKPKTATSNVNRKTGLGKEVGAAGGSKQQQTNLEASQIIEASGVKIPDTGLLPRNLRTCQLAKVSDLIEGTSFDAPERPPGGTPFKDPGRYKFCMEAMTGQVMIRAAQAQAENPNLTRWDLAPTHITHAINR